MCVCVSIGVFICRGKEDALVTKNMVVGESVYGEKRINVEVRCSFIPASLFRCIMGKLSKTILTVLLLIIF